MSNFGIGLGSFVDGFNKGWRSGEHITEGIKRNQSMKAKKQAIDGAKVDYDKSVADDVLTQAGQADPEAAFDMEVAKTTAKKNVGSFSEFLYEKKMPEMIDTMIQSGDFQGAEVMRKWSEDSKERKFMDSFGKTLGAWSVGKSSGDYEPFAKSAVDLLNKGGYGMTASGYELVKNSEGQTTGLTLDLKQGDQKMKHTFNSIDEAAQFLSAQGSPVNRVKQWQAEQAAATKTRADTISERIKAAIGMGKEIGVEGVKQQGRIQLAGVNHDNDMQRDASKASGSGSIANQNASFKIEALRKAGYNDGWINENMPLILGIEPARKGASLEETVRMTRQQLMQNDPEFPDLSPEDQNARIKEVVKANQIISGDLQKPNNNPVGLGAAQPSDLPVYR